MNYLIIKCKPLNDPYECSVSRFPVCLTNDPPQYGFGYEIWEVQVDGTLTCIKEYDIANESGMALYFWRNDADDEDAPQVVTKIPGLAPWEVSADTIDAIIRMANFTEAKVEEILDNVRRFGAYGEEVDDCWVVFGSYEDDCFECGY